jgi:hypothetical protein
VPPAFSQSAWFFAAVTSPAKAGPVKASAKATAIIAMGLFMTFLRYADRGRWGNANWSFLFRESIILGSRKCFALTIPQG